MIIFDRKEEAPLNPKNKQHQDFAYNYIDKVNELYEQLRMPVYGIYKVKNRQALKEMQGLIKVLQGCSREEIKAIKEFFRRPRR